MNAPKRAVTLSIEISADSYEEALRHLDNLARYGAPGALPADLGERTGERAWHSISGGYHVGHVVRVDTDPAMTHDAYFAALDRYLEAERQPAAAFKRHGDPHGCPEREHSCALGTRMHCRLEAGHQPLGHDFDPMPVPADSGLPELCGHGLILPDVEPGCGHDRAAHGTPHAMEASGPYVLEHDR